MPSRVNTVRRKEFPYEIKTLSGNELHNFNTHADSEYLVIDLGNVKGRRSDFNKTIEVAMSAAMNAVLASMPELVPVAKKSKAASPPSAVKSVNEAVDGLDKQARTARNAQRREQLNARILADSVWLTARELSEKASFKNTNPSAGPNRWKSAGRIFALQLNGKDKYPEYALDEGFRPIPVVRQVISLLGEKKTPWGLAIWFGSENSWLDGKKPKDMLATMPKQVLLAAQAEAEGGAHG
ncbi:integrase [Yersinia enterocolitica]|uniref:integrase n=1 Tax=Yersinia enterocolitica TaxID=630 RepID=UPI001C8D3297|nr:integrase [Yersinia enterocolitica]MBX9477391.1 integrase [Yersinia enterocolitica]HEN3634210.1 integrase [Yersinia enterocolitica]HEN3638711.1 integrase [Yersinia enterocolitica]